MDHLTKKLDVWKYGLTRAIPVHVSYLEMKNADHWRGWSGRGLLASAILTTDIGW